MSRYSHDTLYYWAFCMHDPSVLKFISQEEWVEWDVSISLDDPSLPRKTTLSSKSYSCVLFVLHFLIPTNDVIWKSFTNWGCKLKLHEDTLNPTISSSWRKIADQKVSRLTHGQPFDWTYGRLKYIDCSSYSSHIALYNLRARELFHQSVHTLFIESSQWRPRYTQFV